MLTILLINKLVFSGELKGCLKLEKICPSCRFRMVAEVNAAEYTVSSLKEE